MHVLFYNFISEVNVSKLALEDKQILETFIFINEFYNQQVNVII